MNPRATQDKKDLGDEEKIAAVKPYNMWSLFLWGSDQEDGAHARAAHVLP